MPDKPEERKRCPAGYRNPMCSVWALLLVSNLSGCSDGSGSAKKEPAQLISPSQGPLTEGKPGKQDQGAAARDKAGAVHDTEQTDTKKPGDSAASAAKELIGEYELRLLDQDGKVPKSIEVPPECRVRIVSKGDDLVLQGCGGTGQVRLLPDNQWQIRTVMLEWRQSGASKKKPEIVHQLVGKMQFSPAVGDPALFEGNGVFVYSKNAPSFGHGKKRRESSKPGPPLTLKSSLKRIGPTIRP